MPATPADVDTISAVMFRSRLAELDLSARQFAIRTGRAYKTVRGWGNWHTESGTRQLKAFPTWVHPLLTAWEAQAAARSSPPR
jgi:hypothetical protein